MDSRKEKLDFYLPFVSANELDAFGQVIDLSGVFSACFEKNFKTFSAVRKFYPSKLAKNDVMGMSSEGKFWLEVSLGKG